MPPDVRPRPAARFLATVLPPRFACFVADAAARVFFAVLFFEAGAAFRAALAFFAAFFAVFFDAFFGAFFVPAGLRCFAVLLRLAGGSVEGGDVEGGDVEGGEVEGGDVEGGAVDAPFPLAVAPRFRGLAFLPGRCSFTRGGLARGSGGNISSESLSCVLMGSVSLHFD